MIKALVVKELRESAGVLAVAALLYAYVFAWLVDWKPLAGLYYARFSDEVPFTGPRFLLPFVLVSLGLALGLGLRQAMKESGNGTYLFLLHRPWPRDAIFLTKLGVGMSLLLGSSMLLIVCYGAWAATPGHMPAPFEWAMTVKAWQFWILLPLIYLGAFLSGLRPGAWYGTRLLPLVGSCVLLLSFVYFGSPGVTSWLALAASYTALAVAICFVARTRDYA